MFLEATGAITLVFVTEHRPLLSPGLMQLLNKGAIYASSSRAETLSCGCFRKVELGKFSKIKWAKDSPRPLSSWKKKQAKCPSWRLIKATGTSVAPNVQWLLLSACVSTKTCADPASQVFNSEVNSLLLECVSKSREDSLQLLAFG